MTTHFFHSSMTGAPTNTNAAGSTLGIIDACLNTGFNVRAVQSASVTANVMTLTYASAHGYESLIWLRLDGAAGGSIVRRCTVTGANTLTIPVTGFADGAVAGTLETRVAPADWQRVFSGTNVGVFRSKVVGPGSTRFFYRVSDNVVSSTPNLLRGFEAMTDANTGSAPFPTVAQQSGEGLIHARATSAVPQPWFLVTDQRTCYFGFSSTSFGQYASGFFGDILPYNTADAFNGVVVCNSSLGAVRLAGSDASQSFFARRANGLGAADTTCGTQPFGTSSGGGRVYPSPITGAMTFARPVLAVDGSSATTSAIRGERRGIMHCSANPIGAAQEFVIFDVVFGVNGRVLVTREANSGTTCNAFPIDEDWA